MKRVIVLSIVLLAWIAPIVAMGLVLELTPNVVTREVDVGTFLSAQARPGGANVTIVQTTRGSLPVVGFFAGLRDERLTITDSTWHGVQVCGQRGPEACVDLADTYIGAFPPVPHAPVWLTYARRMWLQFLCLLWGLFGAAVFMLALSITVKGDDA